MRPHRRKFETLLSADVVLRPGALAPIGACVTRRARAFEYASKGVEGDPHGDGQMVSSGREPFEGSFFLAAKPSACFGFSEFLP